MLRQILLVAVVVLALVSNAHAELNIHDTLGKLPNLKQGIAYSLVDNKINYLSTAEIVKYKGFALEAGYAGNAEETNHKAVGVISYRLGGLKDLGVDVPVLDLISVNLGVYGGYGHIQLSGDKSNDNEWDIGASATILDIHF